MTFTRDSLKSIPGDCFLVFLKFLFVSYFVASNLQTYYIG